jgi:acyl transferase domain-containing protein/NADPH:quinone reductase-like Zn-dependent oxidoreductase/acyl carrier protein
MASRGRAPGSSKAAHGLEPIALVGIGCRFPGASDRHELWGMLSDGRDAITEIPPDRFDIEAYYDKRPAVPGLTTSRWGGLVSDVEGFDAAFFGIAPREAVYIDPQQRLLLEVAWEALEDAGEPPERLVGSSTGVFIGETSSDYGELVAADPSRIDSVYMITGSGRGITSGRLSFVFDLRGPSITLDAACASSLLAVHLACQSVWKGESGMALAGGSNLVLVPHGTVGFSQAGMAAADGRCKAFSADGDGFVRSDGIGVVLLKPLHEARIDGNPIYAVIRGTGASNDGRSSGLLMTPGQQGQETALRAAYRQADVDPRDVAYVEAHGTGTVAGDPVEIAALMGVLGQGRSAEQRCLVGSVKTNIGHAEAAAGIAGLIKTALCLHHRAIPASLHAQNLNPAIHWDTIPFAVPQTLTPWPTNAPALAGVSSFGISGTNVHVVLEGAPAGARSGRDGGAIGKTPTLLPLSARSPEALRELASAYIDVLTGVDEASFADICASASLRRAHHEHRVAVAARTPEEAAERLTAAVGAGAGGDGAARTKRKVVFVFPGQGGQWRGMGRQLLAEEPVFATTLRECADAMSQYTDWSLLDQIGADEHDADWSALDRIQPTIFAIQVALAELWRSWGIEPDAIVGHSMGEIAGAYVAGALSLDDAAHVICRRSALLLRLRGRGAMALVGLSMDETADALAGYNDRLSVAVCNSPTATVISGETSALASFTGDMESRGVDCRRIEVDFASHGPQIDEIAADVLVALAGVTPQSSTVPIYSTVTGRQTDGTGFDPEYWVKNLRSPVLFAPAIAEASDDGHSVFVEISPNPILTGAVIQICRDRSPGTAVVPSTRRGVDEQLAMLEALSRLYGLGASVRWDALHPVRPPSVSLPRYPWQHQRFWAAAADQWKIGQSEGGATSPRRRADGALAHPLLARASRLASRPELHTFETVIGPQLFSYLEDHRVQGVPVFPAAGYMEMAWAAAEEVLGAGDIELRDLRFLAPLVLTPSEPATLRLELSTESRGRAVFEIFSSARDRFEPTAHARGMLELCGEQAPADAVLDTDSIRCRCTEELSRLEYYETLERAGLSYGVAFQGIREVIRGQDEALGTVELPDGLETAAGRYLVHPALLDACLQVLAASVPDHLDASGRAETFVPASLGRARLSCAPPSRLLSHVRIAPTGDNEGRIVGDVAVADEDGRVVLSAKELEVRPITGAGLGRRIADWMYELAWEPTEPLPDVAADAGEQWVVLSDERGAGEALIEELESEGVSCIRVAHGVGGEHKAGAHVLDPSDGDAWRTFLKDVSAAGPLGGIVHLWSLDIPERDRLTPDLLRDDQALACTSVMRLIQSLPSVGTHSAPRLVLVTCGAQACDDNAGAVAVGQAPLWGMGRALDYEHPELACKLVDVSATGSAQVEAKALCRELLDVSRESQVLLRGTQRYVARMIPPAEAFAASRSPAAEPVTVRAAHDQPIVLATRGAGVLDNLEWVEGRRQPPGPGEAQIEVSAVGLNFNDVLGALGVNLGQADSAFEAGYECAGRVVGVGEEVTDLEVGDEVIAVSHPCFGSYVTTPACLVVRKPPGLTFEQAAALPVAYVTAHHALCDLARLAAGERVLVHAAAGGVGLAAVHIAQVLGAEVFATAGSPEKRELLRGLGVEHVMDSRSLEFADEIYDATEGRGVDVVLNSLAGAAMERSFDALARFGRFVEIGKRDLYEHNRRIGLHHFQKSVSFFTVDLKRLGEERPEVAGGLLRDAITFFGERGLPALPVRCYAPDAVLEAFRHMSQARHVGKIVVALKESRVSVAPSRETRFRSDGTYLISGGMGGLGMEMARWMADRGAGTLVLLGRREITASIRQQIRDIEAIGSTVVARSADVTDEQQVREVLDLTAQGLPPLRGVIHAAAVLDDGIAAQLTEERMMSVLEPKVLGAWNLHRLTSRSALDFFVLFSSAAGIFGSPGQASYCAGNTFLDALSQLRGSQGLPSLSIAWGAWAGVGLAAEREDRGKRLARRGLGSMTVEEGLEAFGEVLRLGVTHAAVVPFDYERWCEFYPRARSEPIFARLRRAQGVGRTPASAVGKAIRAAEPGERLPQIERYLSERAAKILGYAEGHIDARRSLQSLGLDSLMAVELCNAVEVDLGVAVPSVSVLKGDSVRGLAALIGEQMLSDDSPPSSTEPDLDHLSDQEVEDLLQALELEASSER